MNISAKIGVACIVSLFFLTGCLTHMEAIVKGNPLRPTFEFEKEIIYLNNGEQLSASSIGVRHNNELFIGVVFNRSLIRAKLP